MMRYTEKRFMFLGRFYIFRLRKHKSRPLERVSGMCFSGLHWGKASLLWERNNPKRKLSNHFAGH
jgi:hypothetical protein